MRKVLFIISSDPRVSHRPAEAIRIAAGTSSWAQVDVSVCLTGLATLMLAEGQEALKDAEQVTSYLPVLREARHPIYVLKDMALQIDESAVNEITLEELSQLALRHDVVARF